MWNKKNTLYGLKNIMEMARTKANIKRLFIAITQSEVGWTKRFKSILRELNSDKKVSEMFLFDTWH